MGCGRGYVQKFCFAKSHSQRKQFYLSDSSRAKYTIRNFFKTISENSRGKFWKILCNNARLVWSSFDFGFRNDFFEVFSARVAKLAQVARSDSSSHRMFIPKRNFKIRKIIILPLRSKKQGDLRYSLVLLGDTPCDTWMTDSRHHTTLFLLF